jgi:hypothetical protein
MTITTISRRRVTALEKAETVALCLNEGFSCTAVALVGIPSRWAWRSGFAKPVLIAVISARLSRVRSPVRREQIWSRSVGKIRNSGGIRICSGWRQLSLPRSSCRREVSADQSAVGSLFCGLAFPSAVCGPQRLLCLAATAAGPKPTGSGARGHHSPRAGGI